MKIFTNKKTWQKLMILLLIIILFQFVFVKPVQAGVFSVALEPITGLFARLGDGIMEIMQRTFLNMDSSGAWIEEKNNFWPTLIIAVVAIALTVLTVASAVASGGMSLTIFLAVAGSVIKIAGGAAIAFFAVNTLHVGSSGYYLPEYQLTPQAIFKNDILAFDVNFFNPKEPKEKKEEGARTEEIPYGSDFYDNMLNVVAKELSQDEYDNFKEKYHVGSTFANYTDEHKNATMHERR